METTTDAATTGMNQERDQGTGNSDGFPRVREYFDLRDALAGPGCPICARVLRAGREVLATLVAEPSPGAPARKTVLTFRALCNAHAWSIHQIPQKPVGLAETYEGFLRGRIETLQRAIARGDGPARPWWSAWVHALGDWARAHLDRWRRIRRCPACRAAQVVERRDLGLLLDLITDMEFARAFEASSGLCLPHLNHVLVLAPDHPNLPRLLEAHVLKVKRLHAEVQDFLRRVKAPLVLLTQAEQNAVWGRVLEWTAGKAGVFGPERDLAWEPESLRGVFHRIRGRGVRGVPRSLGRENADSRMDEVERLSLENAKLQRRLVEVSREWAEESARRAALQFQVHKLTEDVKVLELNLAGARGEAKSGDIQAARLREEIQALRDEIRRLRAGQGDASDHSGGGGGPAHLA
ncbi:MAG: hypothetical protein HYW08_00975 [candidate division NC10 bacterium]|nr:hypothetical protein [candidate division NC10 bacterium]